MSRSENQSLTLEKATRASAGIAGHPDGISSHAQRHVWRRARANALSLLATAMLVGIATIGLLLLNKIVPLSLVSVIYLIPVVIAATRWGFWPAAVASTAGAAAADFFFYVPYYSLRVDNPDEAVDLLLFLFVAFITSKLASSVRREANSLRRSERHIHSLYEFSRQLALCFTAQDLVLAIHSYVSTALGQRAAFVASSDDIDVRSLDGTAMPGDIRREAMVMITTNELQTRRPFDGLSQTFWLLKAVSSESINHGVIAVDVGNNADGLIEQNMQRIEEIIEEAALTLQRIDIGRAMDEARLRLQADLLKDALHGIVSHELRTPLASILGAASVLNATPALHGDRMIHSLIDGIHDEATQLDGFLQNLVNASRVTSEGVRPRLEWTDPADIINAALERRTRRLSQHRIQVEFEGDLPLVKADSVLVEEACGQLLDNAAKYSPTGSTIAIVVRSEASRIGFSVLDEGAGLTPEEKSQLGRRSFRGQRHLNTVPGFGLGLWIASAFIKANGGTLEIINRGTRPGTIASLFLPVVRQTTPGLATAGHE